MTDNTASSPIEFWIPIDIWSLIASFLDNDELAQFRQVCKSFDGIGSDAMVLQPIYNRLRAINKRLPADLQTAAEQTGKSPLIFFKDTFEKIQAGQQQEIAYLTQHHAAMMATPAHASITLKSLETKHALLDAVNSEIVTARIDINSTELNLSYAHITRLPVTLFKAAGYAHFWGNLTNLNCHNNQLTELNVQGLAALQTLNCDNNQLTALNVQGLAVHLNQLDCHNNQLTELNVQGLTALQRLWCNNNQLTTLNVQGLLVLVDLSCNNNQLTELTLQGLVALRWLRCQDNQLPELNVQGLTALQILDCDNNQLTALNVQGLLALSDSNFGPVLFRGLNCNGNPLTDLNLTGVHVSIKNQYAELERSLLFNQLSQVGSIEAMQEIITRLGADYTDENCLRYGVSNISGARLQNQNAHYLPSPFNGSQKRPRSNEEKTQGDERPKAKHSRNNS